MLIQLHIYRICTFWPNFYRSILKPKENICSVWEIINNPVPPTGTKSKTLSVCIFCLYNRYYCHSFYQVKGGYTRLNEKLEKGLDYSVKASTIIVCYDEPLRLAIPYEFLVKRLQDPPYGVVKKYSQLDLYSLYICIQLFVELFVSG